MEEVKGPTRRSVVIAGAASAAVLLLAPRLVSATPAQVQGEIEKLYAGKALSEGKIRLDLPTIAENGLVVPITFEVESPMTEGEHVKAVHIFADGNPNPGVASFFFTPRCYAADRRALP